MDFIYLLLLYQIFLHQLALSINVIYFDDIYLNLIKQNSSLCDLKISTNGIIIFDKCKLSTEWKIDFFSTDSKTPLLVYETSKTPRRTFNFDYVTDAHKIQPDIKFLNVSINAITNDNLYSNEVAIFNFFPTILKKGDNFDVIVDYEKYNSTYRNIILSIFMQSDLDSHIIQLDIKYIKIVNIAFNFKNDFSYLVLVISYIIFMFLTKQKYLVDEKHFVQINIEEIIQVKNAESIFFASGMIVVVILFFIIIGYIYYITIIFSILLGIISVKSSIKYLFRKIIPKITRKMESYYSFIYKFKLDASKIICYLLSTTIIIIWYRSKGSFHIILNNIIFFIMVYVSVHKLNWKKFYMIITLFLIAFIYQIVNIILEPNICQKDSNIYYITTKFIIDAPIRFILPDLINAPFEEIYYFTILDITLVGFVIQYCEHSLDLNNSYLKISFYCCFVGLLLNILFFYGIRFSPPISMFPLIISIIVLVSYSIYNKEFIMFVDMTKRKEHNTSMNLRDSKVIENDKSISESDENDLLFEFDFDGEDNEENTLKENIKKFSEELDNEIRQITNNTSRIPSVINRDIELNDMGNNILVDKYNNLSTSAADLLNDMNEKFKNIKKSPSPINRKSSLENVLPDYLEGGSYKQLPKKLYKSSSFQINKNTKRNYSQNLALKFKNKIEMEDIKETQEPTEQLKINEMNNENEKMKKE